MSTKWIPEKAYRGDVPKGFGWAIYLNDINREYKNKKGDHLLFDTKKQSQEFCDKLNKEK